MTPISKRGVTEVFPGGSEALDLLLNTTNRPLRIKLGVDPTRPDLHLGHTVVLNKLRQFQDLGHTAVLIIGDFTALIGDPTGRSEARPRLTPEEVAFNAQTYFEQARKVLNFEANLETHYNSAWLAKLDLSQITDLLATMTLQQMLAKEGFRERYGQQQPVYLHEFLYPLMQGYDSVAIRADVELGGTDQKFNLAVGRDLQLHKGQKPQLCLLTPLLVGLDGVKKMSKSQGNYVGITEHFQSMYDKLEKVPDALIDTYFQLLTSIDPATLPESPRERQKLLALSIVGQFYDPDLAQQAQYNALQRVQGNTTALSQMPEFSLDQLQTLVPFPAQLAQILKATGLAPSTSEARKLIQGGGVKLRGEKISDPQLKFDRPEDLVGALLEVGKKKSLLLVAGT